MSWNHRILKRIHKEKDGTESVTYWICEAYYPDGIESDTPGHTLGIEPMSEDLVGLQSVLEQMLKSVTDVTSGVKNFIVYNSQEGDDEDEDDG